MMKKILQITCLCMSVSFVNAQSGWDGTTTLWKYDLQGARNADLVTTHGDTYALSNVTTPITSSNLGWFPQPSGATSVLQARAATGAEAKYTLLRDGENKIKSIKMDISKGTSLNKVIVRDIDNAVAKDAAKFSLRLKTHYDTGDNKPTENKGSIFLVFGHYKTGTGTSGEGAYFSDGNRMLPTTIPTYYQQAAFACIRLTYEQGSSTFKVGVKKVTSITSNTATLTDITSDINNLNVHNGDYLIDVYCNNSAADKTYTLVGGTTAGTHIVLPQTFHLVINGNKIGEYETGASGNEPVDEGKELDAFAIDVNAGSSGDYADYGKAAIEISDMEVSYTPETVLPVSLASFTANYNGSSIKLNWKTLSEKDNSHFEVLRSGDGITFSEITRVSGAGNSAGVVNYTTTDYNPLEGVNYYQLKQVDNDGEYTLSDIIAVNTSFEDNTLKIVKKEGALGVTLYSASPSVVNVYVTDIGGRRLYNQKVQVSAGKNQFDIAVSSLAAGVYVFSIESGGKTQRVKFVN